MSLLNDDAAVEWRRKRSAWAESFSDKRRQSDAFVHAAMNWLIAATIYLDSQRVEAVPPTDREVVLFVLGFSCVTRNESTGVETGVVVRSLRDMAASTACGGRVALSANIIISMSLRSRVGVAAVVESCTRHLLKPDEVRLSDHYPEDPAQ